MFIKSLRIQNFKGIEDIEFDLDRHVNLIVGPNAVGKTTLLEGIRLAKGILAPRSPGEQQQVLNSLGASTPHMPQRIVLSALMRKMDRPLEIKAVFVMSDDDWNLIEAKLDEIAVGIVQAQMGMAFNSPAALADFFSSKQGQEAVKNAREHIDNALKEKKASGSCLLHLKLDPNDGLFRGVDDISQAFIRFRDQFNPPSEASFSYFPADRALPVGEIPVQLGSADAQAQLESHSSQPQTKYSRLKNTIFGAVIQTEQGRKELETEFERIFDQVLKGRKLTNIGVNEVGLLSIRVQDTASQFEFDLDGLSSGEKGLILTFLLIARSISNDGIVLLDEPELHLNPAVCRTVLSFMIDAYVLPKHLQLIICSHSPEIVAAAFERPECTVFHLVSENLITRVREKDPEAEEALRRLGTSASESLLFEATLFVEGDTDADMLEIGFPDLLRRYRVKGLGGRTEIEKQIGHLQAREEQCVDIPKAFFVFDLDNKPTSLRSTAKVKVLQWDRRMIENYLIDSEVIFDILLDNNLAKNPPANIGAVEKLLKELALSQLDESVARMVYKKQRFATAALHVEDVQQEGLEKIAEALSHRMEAAKEQLVVASEQGWKENFLRECAALKAELKPRWEEYWQQLCDGKRLFNDLQRRIQINDGMNSFKARLMREMRSRRRPNWEMIEKQLIAT